MKVQSDTFDNIDVKMKKLLERRQFREGLNMNVKDYYAKQIQNKLVQANTLHKMK